MCCVLALAEVIQDMRNEAAYPSGRCFGWVLNVRVGCKRSGTCWILSDIKLEAGRMFEFADLAQLHSAPCRCVHTTSWCSGLSVCQQQYADIGMRAHCTSPWPASPRCCWRTCVLYVAGLAVLEALEEGTPMRVRKESASRSSTGMGRHATARVVVEGAHAKLVLEGQVGLHHCACFALGLP